MNHQDSNELIRKIHLDGTKPLSSSLMPSNEMQDLQYSWLRIIPYNLFKQFHRVSNIWFLIVSIFELLPYQLYSTTSWNTIIPLSFLLLISLVKDIYTCYRFNSKIKCLNSELIYVWNGEGFVKIESKYLHEGMIIKIDDNQTVPADTLLIARKNSSDLVFLDISRLVGSFSLVEKKVLESIELIMRSQESNYKDVSALQGTVKFTEPSSDYLNFFGTIQLDNHPKATKLTIKNLLVAGGVLKGSESVIGLVIYTGFDSKLRLNTQKYRQKFSKVEKSVNMWVLLILAFVFLLVIFSVTGYYLSGNNEESFFKIFILYCLLYSNMIPISLFFAIDIIRTLQSFLYKNKNIGVQFVNDGLNENLGQIEYLITDISATFSESEKIVDVFSFNHKKYFKQSEKALCTISTEKILNIEKNEEGLNFEEFHIMLNDRFFGENCHQFVRSLCLCNNLVQSNHNFFGLPEDIALIKFGEKLGYKSDFSGQKNVNLYYQNSLRPYKKVIGKYLAPGKTRISVIVEDFIEGCGYIYTKGFSKSIFNHLKLNEMEHNLILEDFHHILEMNSVPFVFAYNEIPSEILIKIKKKIKKSKKSLLNINNKIELIFNELEKDLKFLGIVGVKEVLQSKVVKTFEMVENAGIKVWLTSSDTYINTIPVANEIGVIKDLSRLSIMNMKNPNNLANLIESGINQYVFNKVPIPTMFNSLSNVHSRPSKNFDDELDDYTYGRQMTNKMQITASQNFDYDIEAVLKNEFNPDILPFCIVIDRTSLVTSLKYEGCKKLLTCLLLCAKSVCFVELMPVDKVSVIKLLKENTIFNPCVAAVGSGDSDFAMIQASDISMGIKRDKDYLFLNHTDVIISNFSQIRKLVLVEGHYFYYRMTKVLLFYFYKNWLFTIIQVAFTIRTQFTGISAYGSSLIFGYNIFFTTIPLIYIGMFDKDVNDEKVKKYPAIYTDGIFGKLFSYEQFIWYSIISVIQGLVIVILTFHILPYSTFSNGFNENMDATGTFVYLTLVATVNLQFLIESFSYSLYFYLTFLLSFLMLFLLTFLLSNSDIPNSDLIGVDKMLASSAFALFSIFLTSIICSIPAIAQKFMKKIWYLNLAERLKISQVSGHFLNKISKFKGPLGSIYKASFSSNIVTSNTNQIRLKKLSLKFWPQFIERRYSQKFIKFYLREYKIKAAILIIFSVIWLIINITSSKNDISNSFIQIMVIIFCIIFLFLLYSQKLRFYYSKYVLILLLLSTIGKLFLDGFLIDANVLLNILFPSVAFLEYNVHWLGICFLNIFNIIQSIIAISLTQNSSNSNPYFISSIHQILLLLSITISSGIQGYFIDYSRRKEYIILKKIKSAFNQSSSILNMLLPAFVKNRVKSGARYIADNQGEVSVIFIDICEFDKICADYNPIELTIFLDKLFSIFDKVCENNGVAKIETVGKTYMACAGLGDFDKDLKIILKKESHAKRALAFAIAILDEVSEIQLLYGENLKVKIGINSGLVTAGVVGYHKPQFSLVGDTVNTASRMCSTLSEYNAIQISEYTYLLVKHFIEYEFVHTKVEAKGKGLVDAYLVSENPKYSIKNDSEYNLAPNSAAADMISPVSFFSGFSISNSRSKTTNSRKDNWKSVLNRTADTNRIDELPRMISNISNQINSIERIFFNEQKIKNHKMGFISLGVACLTYCLLFLIIMLEKFVSNTVKSNSTVALRGFVCGYLIILCVFYKYHLRFRKFELVIIPCITLMYLTTLSFIYNESEIPAGIICAEIVYTGLILSQISSVPFILFALIVLLMFLIWLSLTIKYDKIADSSLFFFVFILFNLLYIRSRFMQERINRKNFNLKIVAKKETKETNALLKKLIPKHVVKALGTGQALTDRLRDVTILYADIVGFTKWSSNRKPSEIVEMLSDLFTSFDKLCVEMDVYKVYTIGDCYVVIGLKNSGVRSPNEECLDVVKMAFRMIQVINQKNEQHGSNLNMRIGIHIGEVTGAVIGTSIVRYDIWGPDVLIANKMESNGESGKVKVSEDTYTLLNQMISRGLKFKESENLEIKHLNILKKTYFMKCKNIENLVMTQYSTSNN